MLNKITKNTIFSALIANTLGLGLLTTMFLAAKPAQAQFRISPMVVNTESKKGVARSIINVSNTSKKPIRVRLSAQPFTYEEDGFTVLESSEADLSPYLTFAPKELLIQPGQKRRVRLLTRLLPSQQNKEYRAVIFAEQLRETTSNVGMTVNSRIGVTVFVSPDGSRPELTASTVNYDAEEKTFKTIVENNGARTVRPIVQWELMKGKESVAKGATSNYTVVANGKRNIPFQLESELADLELSGEYQVQGNIVLGDPRRPIQEVPFEFDLDLQ